MTAPTITDLPALIADLPPEQRALVDRLFQVVAEEGALEAPDEMHDWLAETFGSVAAAERQRVVRVMNRWTFEGATINPLRSRRPNSGFTQRGPGGIPTEVVRAIRYDKIRGDDFCHLEQRTTRDAFGRIEGTHVVTASNVAKADGWHAVGVFRKHNPLAIDAALVADIFDVGVRWAERAQAADTITPEACHFFLFWNCLWRAGCSQIHGHTQMTLSHAMAHAGVERLRAAAERYRRETGGDYFADLIAAHRALGLAADAGEVVLLASLTPIKEREVLFILPVNAAPEAPWAERLQRLAAPIARALDVALRRLGTLTFNVAAFGPPMPADATPDPAWQGFPFMARFVDRGNPLARTSDVAAMELFGSSVIASDPFELARALRGEVLA
ncbi:MAG TPA: hypothetical protein VH540_15660 [Ktedonobacterales bacterium]|jgi:hypothetical protein